MKRSFLVVALLLMILLQSCAPTRELSRARTLTLDEVLLQVRERHKKIETIEGEGALTVESPEASNSGSFNVMLKKPDSLRLELSGPFGIHVGTLMLSRDQFLFYNWMENTAIVGKPDGSSFGTLFRIKLQFDEVLNAFTGAFSLSSEGDSLERFYVENDLYVLRYRTSDGMKEYRVDGENFIITSYRILDLDGKAILIAMASRFEDNEIVAMPMLIRVVFPSERRSVTIAYDELRINEPVQCSFTLPKQAEVIYR